jgi:PKD repeat protein
MRPSLSNPLAATGMDPRPSRTAGITPRCPAGGLAWVGFLAAAAVGGCKGGGGSPAADHAPPSVPTGLTASVASAGGIDLWWTASTDDFGVAGYNLFRDGTYLGSVAGTSMADAGVTRAVPHCYTISAYDLAGNESARSAPACATIPDQPPVATLDGPPSELTGLDVTFDASASTDPDGSVVLYAFDFGDDAPVVTQSTPMVVHAYAAAGTYTVSLVVTDDVGLTASTTRRITIGLVLSAPVDVSNTPTWSQAASMSRDPAGNLYAVWEESRNDILFSRSTDGGLTFAPATYVVDPNGPLGSGNDYSSGHVRVVSPAGTIHVAWTLFDLLFGGAEIFHAGSNDGGATFGAAQIVSAEDGVNSYAPSIAADDAGSVAIAWGDSDLNTGQTAVSYSRFVDGGATFSVPLVLSPSGMCPGVALSSSNHYVAWTDGVFGQEQIFFSRSTDGGGSFSLAVTLDDVPQKSWCPLVAVDAGGSVYVAWEEGAAFTDRKILLSRSTDAGATFGAPAVLSDPVTDASCVSLVAAGTGRIVVTWSTIVDAVVRDSFLVISSDGGGTFTTPLQIPPPAGGAGCYGLVAGAGNEIGLFWSAAPGGLYADVYHRIATLSIP